MLIIGRLPHKFQAAAQGNNATQGKTTTTAFTRRAANTSPVLTGGALRGPASYWKLNETKLNETSGTQTALAPTTAPTPLGQRWVRPAVSA